MGARSGGRGGDRAPPRSGPHDPGHGQPRPDHFPHDGARSPVWVARDPLARLRHLPPSEQAPAVRRRGLATLAGAGWDGLRGGTRRLRRLGLAGLGASLVGLALSWAARARAIAFLAARVPPETAFGPVNIAGAWAETQRALAHGAIVSATALALAHWAPRRPARPAAWPWSSWPSTSPWPTPG